MIASQAGVAQAPAGAPAGAPGLCNDGSYWTGASKSGQLLKAGAPKASKTPGTPLLVPPQPRLLQRPRRRQLPWQPHLLLQPP